MFAYYISTPLVPQNTTQCNKHTQPELPLAHKNTSLFIGLRGLRYMKPKYALS